MTVLDKAWAERDVNQYPFPWLSTEPSKVFSLETAQRLAEDFPVDGFVRHDTTQRQGGDKRYRNFSRSLAEADACVDPGTAGVWDDLLADLRTVEYREQVAGLLGQRPANAVELRLVRHAPGDWLGPHTDRPDKMFSHIFYFNALWRPEWGGCLEILNGDDPTSLVSRIVPQLGVSALLARTDNSWHQVTKVSGPSSATRMSLLVHGVR